MRPFEAEARPFSIEAGDELLWPSRPFDKGGTIPRGKLADFRVSN